MHVVIVGGGIVGTAHALEAVRRGHHVTQFEREPEARGATPRSLGLVRVSGCAPYHLAGAHEARLLWEELGGKVPGLGFRAVGSVTVLRTPGELAVATEAARRDDRFDLLEPDRVRAVNPALRGNYLGGLYCADDAVIEARQELPALHAYLDAMAGYEFRRDTAVLGIDTSGTPAVVHDDHGGVHTADLVVVCSGAEHAGLVRDLAGDLRVRRVRAMLLATAPLDEPFPTAVADGDSLRHHPAFAGDARDALQHNESRAFAAAAHDVDLVCVPRVDGGLTIGCARNSTEPLDFDLTDAATQYLTDTVAELLGRRLPPVTRRWSGEYSESKDPSALASRRQVGEHVWVVTGAGSRGLTMAPYVAHETAELAGM
mgnify:CR=1 FL=1